jgi:hypothetical protein
MRLAALVVVCAAAATAHAEGVPIVVAPFSGRCFDAARLAERVRAQVGDELTVVVAPTTAVRGGSYQEVSVRERDGAVTVTVVARDPHGRLVGRAERLVPSEVDCPTALSIAALMVARAALPLTWREPPAPTASPSPRPAAAPAPPPTPAPAPSPPSPPPATAPVRPPPSPSPPIIVGAARATTSPPTSGVPTRASPAPARTAPAAPELPALVLRAPARPFAGELAVAAYGAFALDGPGAAHAPGGELAAGFRHRRFGAAVRAAVENSWSASATSGAGDIRLDIRRVTVGLEAHADLALRVGVLRFAAGPTLPLYLVRATGIPHPRTSIVTSAGATARVLYHLDLGRVFLSAGVTCEVGFIREELTVTGAGRVARPPLVTLGPLLALGVSL